jgi:hypothetical protein
MHPAHCIGVRLCHRDADRFAFGGKHGLLLYVLRYRNHDRPRRAGYRDAYGLRRNLGELRRIGGLGDPFRDGAVHLLIIDLLKRLPA